MDRTEWRGNAMVRDIARRPRWSWTVVEGGRKKPVSAVDYERTRGACQWGAYETDGRCLMDLAGVERVAADPQIGPGVPDNRAYHLEALEDGLVCLDVERTASEEQKARFLEMPYLYGEESMSGEGLHLWFALPDLDAFPDARAAQVLRAPDGTYELLLEHWVTFTGRALPKTSNPGGAGDFGALWRELAAQAAPRRPAAQAVDASELPEGARALVSQWVAASDPEHGPFRYRKRPEDFMEEGGPNMNRWEWGYIGSACRWVKRNAPATLGHEPDGAELAALLHACVARTLPHRDKHDERRQGRPFLLWRCERYVAEHKG